ASLVMLVDAGEMRVLLLADTGYEEQDRLLRDAGRPGGVALTADVVKIAHHGSRDQDPRLPVATHADWAIVSVGADNGYGHPAAQTLASFARAGSRVLRTDLMGSVALSPDGNGGLDAWVERGGAARGGSAHGRVGAPG